MIKKNLKAILRYFKRISYIYVLYRILNILIISAIGSMNISSLYVNSREDNTTPYANFEYPAPNLNNVITYETLAWCHKCLISENEFYNYSDYGSIERKIIISFILLPWTIPIDLLQPANDDYRHQYNHYYDIDVWCGHNVFSGKYEQIFFYYGDWILLCYIWAIRNKHRSLKSEGDFTLHQRYVRIVKTAHGRFWLSVCCF